MVPLLRPFQWASANPFSALGPRLAIISSPLLAWQAAARQTPHPLPPHITHTHTQLPQTYVVMVHNALALEQEAAVRAIRASGAKILTIAPHVQAAAQRRAAAQGVQVRGSRCTDVHPPCAPWPCAPIERSGKPSPLGHF